MKKSSLFWAITCLTSALPLFNIPLAAADIYTNQKNYTDLRFGMFIHYNMGTYHDQEWVSPWQDPNSFNPSNVDTDQWADAAKSANMKYAVLTTKHHDGFALWPSKWGNYNVMNSAYKQDIVQKYVTSMRAKGILPGLYFSIWDRQRGIQNNSIGRGDIEFIKDQLTELLTNYGEIPVLIIDGWAWEMGHNQVPYQEIRELVKRLQPNILIVDHNGQTQPWDEDIIYFEEPKGVWAPNSNTYAANQGKPLVSDQWFWHWWMPNTEPASVASIVNDHLGYLEPRYTNMLVNVSPNPQGALDTNVVNRLAEIGAAWTPNTSRPALPAQPIVLDHPITANSAIATSGNANNVIDGSLDYVNTYVETLWQSSASLPQSITLDLGYTYNNINMLNYLPSQNLTDGQITSYALYASSDGSTFNLVTSGTWSADKTMKRVTFASQIARYIKLQVNGASGGYAAASELEVGSYTNAIPTATGIDTFDANAVYRIVNKASGKALGVNSSTANGTQITQRTSVDAVDQKWIIEDLGKGKFKITNKLSGIVMDVSGGSQSGGANIIQWTDSESYWEPSAKNQQWNIANTGGGYFKITSVNSGLALENSNALKTDGNPVIQNNFTKADKQLWSIQKISDNYDPAGYYKIINLQSNKAIDVSGGSYSAGAPIIQWPFTSGDNQLWKIETVGNLASGQYKLTNKRSSLVLDVSGAVATDGALITQSYYTGANNQKWNIQFMGKGLYKITNGASGKSLDVSGSSLLDSAGIVQFPYTGDNDQQWLLIRAQ